MTIKIKDQEILLYKRRRYARLELNRAIRDGRIERGTCCSFCATDKYIQAHHVDYGKPLSVIWLCKKCHGSVHTKDHPLNPSNNEQSPLPYLNENDLVNVTFFLPVKNFLALSKIADTENLSISALLKKEVTKKYPVQSKQMDLFTDYDNTRKTQRSGISSMGENERSMQQYEESKLQKLWRSGDINLQQLEQEFSYIPLGHGRDAQRLQCVG